MLNNLLPGWGERWNGSCPLPMSNSTTKRESLLMIPGTRWICAVDVSDRSTMLFEYAEDTILRERSWGVRQVMLRPQIKAYGWKVVSFRIDSRLTICVLKGFATRERDGIGHGIRLLPLHGQGKSIGIRNTLAHGNMRGTRRILCPNAALSYIICELRRWWKIATAFAITKRRGDRSTYSVYKVFTLSTLLCVSRCEERAVEAYHQYNPMWQSGRSTIQHWQPSRRLCRGNLSVLGRWCGPALVA